MSTDPITDRLPGSSSSAVARAIEAMRRERPRDPSESIDPSGELARKLAARARCLAESPASREALGVCALP